MVKIKAIRVATLLLFTTLIIGFVAFKAGYFDNAKPTYDLTNFQDTLKNRNDSVSVNDSFKKLELMPSSKSLIIRDHNLNSEDKSRNKNKYDSIFRVDPMIYSSKSGKIIDRKDIENMNLDSLLKDTLKK